MGVSGPQATIKRAVESLAHPAAPRVEGVADFARIHFVKLDHLSQNPNSCRYLSRGGPKPGRASTSGAARATALNNVPISVGSIKRRTPLWSAAA